MTRESLLGLGVLVALFGIGCGAKLPVGGAREAVVYGEDDRTDVYAHSDADLRELTRDSIVALIRPDMLDTSDPENIGVSAYTLGDAYYLCEGERFRDQPTAAGCSGTLIDDDLVLTAGHCVSSDEDCENWRLVFDYYMADSQVLETLTRDAVFGCERVVARELTSAPSRDYAIVQLDRPATDYGRVPVEVRTGEGVMSRGEPVTIVGFGSGIPAKIDNGGEVLNPRAGMIDYFTATTDSFGGNSGSGVFDASRKLVGALVRGDEDYVRQGDCYVVNELPETGGPAGGEDVAYLGRALDGLCASGWPSERLCGTAAVCGDGLCTGVETLSTCAADCGTVEPAVPEDWLCDAGSYDARDGCDCACGEYDPDCDAASQTLYGCAAGQTCSAAGECMTPGAGVWACPADQYASGDGCDCACGAYDPDCADNTQPVLNCPSDYVCDSTGSCAATSNVVGQPRRTAPTCGVARTANAGGAPAALVLAAVAGISLARRRRVKLCWL